MKLNGVFKEREGKISRFYYIGFILIATLLAVLTDFFNKISCDMWKLI